MYKETNAIMVGDRAYAGLRSYESILLGFLVLVIREIIPIS